MTKIMFICTGNTCRSAMAAALFNHFAVEKNLDFRAISAGVAAFSGDSASYNAIAVLNKIGVDLTEHRSSALTKFNIEQAWHFYCMTDAHKHVLTDLDIDEKRITVLNVSDPFGASLEAYAACRDEILEKIDEIIGVFNSSFESADLTTDYIKPAADLAAKYLGDGFSENILKAQLENDQYTLRGAFRSGHLLGFACAKIVDDYAEILAIVVDEKYRGSAIGFTLAQEILDIAEHLLAKTVSLEVRESNNAAINLYKMLGFAPNGTRENFYTNPTENAIVLTMNLGDKA